MTQRREPLNELVHEAKRLIMSTAMSSELGVLSDALARIARADRHTRDFTLNSLRELITEYVACIPVYRTYVSHRGWTDEDERIIDRTIAEARQRNPAMEGSLFRFLREVLLPNPAGAPATGDSSMRDRRLSFAMKLQQYTGPVQAKGVEDTTFYRHNVLVSMNEVGGEPARAVQSVADVHASNSARMQHWPAEMTTLSTHDTKLGEDVRARINVLSELVDEWRDTLGRVLRATAAVRVPGTSAPDRNDEYRFLQVLIGCWPPGVPVQAPAPEPLVRRLQAYMLKAVREAKRHTSWLTPNDSYEAGMLSYVEAILRGPQAPRALSALRPLAERVARQGVTSSIAQTVLKLTSPGVPDVYQGSEDWVFDLVDPDNRRPVRFDRLAQQLDDVERLRASQDFGPHQVREWLEQWPNGDVKRHVVSTLLRARRDAPDLWLRGAYRALPVEAPVDATALAFARTASGRSWAITAAGLRTARLPGAWPVGRAWAIARLLLPPDAPTGPWRDLLSGVVVKPVRTSGARWLLLSQAFAALPVAVLVADERVRAKRR